LPLRGSGMRSGCGFFGPFFRTRMAAVCVLASGCSPSHTSPPVSEQAPTTLRVAGIVRDAGGAHVSGAKVLLVSPTQTKPLTAATDEDGRYQFVNLAPGQYRL